MKRVVIGALGAIALASGCNALLGNEEGHLKAAVDGGNANDASVSDAPPDAPITGDGAGPPDAEFSCSGKDQKACPAYQACVPKADPNFGCGEPQCEACGSEHASKVECVFGDASIVCKPTCNDGFANCDGTGGCETDLSKPDTCGDCTKKCSPDAGGALCSKNSVSGKYECVSSCPAGTVECAGVTGKCINTQTDPEHCGGCSHPACFVPKNGSATCTGGVCGSACNPLNHKCNDGDCYGDSDVTHCGAGCVDCTQGAPANATGVTCQSGQCVWTSCMAGWGDCDGDLAKGTQGTGCETDLYTDSMNCGKCLYACNSGPILVLHANYYVPPTDGTQICCNGTCQSSDIKCYAVR